MELSTQQIKRLRAEGHRLNLKPVVIVGQKGLGENLHGRNRQRAQSHHELVKLRIPALDKAGKRELAGQASAHATAPNVNAEYR